MNYGYDTPDQKSGNSRIAARVTFKSSNGCTNYKNITIEYNQDTLESARERIKCVRANNPDIQIVGSVKFDL